MKQSRIIESLYADFPELFDSHRRGYRKPLRESAPAMKKYIIELLCSDFTKYTKTVSADNYRSAWIYAGELIQKISDAEGKDILQATVEEKEDIVTWTDSAGSFAEKDCGDTVLLLDSEDSSLTEYRKNPDPDLEFMPEDMNWSLTYNQLDVKGKKQFDEMAIKLEKETGEKVKRY